MAREYESDLGQRTRQDSAGYGAGNNHERGQGRRFNADSGAEQSSDRGYGGKEEFRDSQQRYEQNELDEYPDGGRGVYTHDRRESNRDTENRRSSRDSYQADEGQSVGAQVRTGRFADDRGMGRDNHGSSKYGGSDYENGDYNRTPAERGNYGGPHTVQAADLDSSEGIGRPHRAVAERSRLYGDDDSVGYDPAAWAQTRGRFPGQNQSTHSQSNQHQGKGPKGYERSDERTRELVCERLTDAPSLDASEITVTVNKREVTLTGSVDSRSAKHLAEDLVESVGGIAEIHNQLKIGNRATSGSTSDLSAQQREPSSGRDS